MTEVGPPRSRRWTRWVARAALIVASAWIADRAFGVVLARLKPGPFFQRSIAMNRTDAQTMVERPFFVADWDRPASLADDAVIGIFGGSMAHSFAQALLHTAAGARWAAPLRGRFGRPVRFLDLSVRGGYEPAQFNLLHLSAHRIAGAVFLDGFNEQFSRAPGCDELSLFWERSTARPSELLHPLADAVFAYDRDLSRARSPWLGRSGLFQLLLYRDSVRMNRVAGDFFTDLAGAPARLGVGPLRPSPGERANDRWEGCVRRSYAFARSRNLPIYFFVQPNQHVAGSKPLTPEESACCVELPLGTPAPVRRTYAEMTDRYDDLDARVAHLQADGIPARSLRGLFRASRQTLYFDWCCHVNDTGSSLIGDAVFGAMTAETP